MTEAQIIEKLRDIEYQLGPEILTCDGERSMTEVRRIVSRLNAERSKLVRMLGREPTFAELYPEE